MLIQRLTHHPESIPVILSSTPVWVWGLMAGLLALGLSQTRGRQVSLLRVLVLPLVMTLMALLGLASAFFNNGHLASALLTWLAVVAASVAVLTQTLSTGAWYDATHQRFDLPGSWVPLALMMGIFVTKYLVGVETAMNPGAFATPEAAIALSALYGLFSGVFVARTWLLLRLARVHVQRVALQQPGAAS